MNNVEKIKSVARNILFSLNKPDHYKYAERNIPCDCPLCPCPSGKSKSKNYGFTYISEKKKIMYFSIPKAASGTIRKIFFPEGNRLSKCHTKRPNDEYFKFTFVRNPWSRIVSNWTMFTKYTGRIRQLKSMTDKDLSKFEDFVHFASSAKNHHWQPQVLFLYEQPDFIGRIERIEQDFTELSDKLDIDIEAPKKTSVSGHRPYWEYYTPSLIEFVGEMYAEDIKRFGYKFGE